MHVPSSSAGDGPALPLVGVFMNKGNMVLSPRISTNFWLLSDPSWPVMAWFNTFIALFLDIFFSLKFKIKILSFSSNRHLNLETSIQQKLEERLFFDSTVQFNEYIQSNPIFSHLNMRFISCSPSPRRNLLRFSERIKHEHKELKRFSIISISSLVLGSCLLYAYKMYSFNIIYIK